MYVMQGQTQLTHIGRCSCDECRLSFQGVPEARTSGVNSQRARAFEVVMSAYLLTRGVGWKLGMERFVAWDAVNCGNKDTTEKNIVTYLMSRGDVVPENVYRALATIENEVEFEW